MVERRYGLYTDSMRERGAEPQWKRSAVTRDDAIKHAQTAANHLRVDVLVVEEVEGMQNTTRVSPKGECTCIVCR